MDFFLLATVPVGFRVLGHIFTVGCYSKIFAYNCRKKSVYSSRGSRGDESSHLVNYLQAVPGAYRVGGLTFSQKTTSVS